MRLRTFDLYAPQTMHTFRAQRKFLALASFLKAQSRVEFNRPSSIDTKLKVQRCMINLKMNKKKNKSVLSLFPKSTQQTAPFMTVSLTRVSFKCDRVFKNSVWKKLLLFAGTHSCSTDSLRGRSKRAREARFVTTDNPATSQFSISKNQQIIFIRRNVHDFLPLENY